MTLYLSGVLYRIVLMSHSVLQNKILFAFCGVYNLLQIQNCVTNFLSRANVGCHVCGSLEHKRRDCPKTKCTPKPSKRYSFVYTHLAVSGSFFSHRKLPGPKQARAKRHKK